MYTGTEAYKTNAQNTKPVEPYNSDPESPNHSKLNIRP